MKKNIWHMLLGLALVITMAGSALSHDDGHSSPDRLPPLGPHGGKYTKLTKHFSEVVVRGKKATVYILERDVKNVAEDATAVALWLEIPGKGKKKLALKKRGEGYEATVKIPRKVRRVYFHISCKLDGKTERGKLLYEPRR